ncbi:hypothetical protein ACOSP7_008841 [Xanthoceras sorbifolium]
MRKLESWESENKVREREKGNREGDFGRENGDRRLWPSGGGGVDVGAWRTEPPFWEPDLRFWASEKGKKGLVSGSAIESLEFVKNPRCRPDLCPWYPQTRSDGEAAASVDRQQRNAATKEHALVKRLSVVFLEVWASEQGKRRSVSESARSCERVAGSREKSLLSAGSVSVVSSDKKTGRRGSGLGRSATEERGNEGTRAGVGRLPDAPSSISCPRKHFFFSFPGFGLEWDNVTCYC